MVEMMVVKSGTKTLMGSNGNEAILIRTLL